MNSTPVETYPILIVGGGTAGITVAARLKRAEPSLQIGLIEPSERHYYQPLWTLVGGGVTSMASTERSESSVMPKGVKWIRDRVQTFHPEARQIVTESGQVFGYEQLVVAPGIQIHWDAIKGLPEALGKGGVSSNYAAQWAPYTWEALEQFQGGHAVFTAPNTPIKCGGAPQKIMYLAEDLFRRKGMRDVSKVSFISPAPHIFGVQKYREALSDMVERRGIHTLFRHHLVEIEADRKMAFFESVDTGERKEVSYDFLHVTPPMGAPDFVKQSSLANAEGWVEVDSKTLQHLRYPDVFSLGDASSLPTSKTGAAIRKQAPVLVKNLLAHRRKKPMDAVYDGYTSCPIVTGYGRLMLAEFDYEGRPQETFPFNQAKERRSMWWLKRYLLPELYWKGMLKGVA